MKKMIVSVVVLITLTLGVNLGSALAGHECQPGALSIGNLETE
ncbi:hypothetical protein [Niallia circulans]|jgi:hypothetical protein|nr:hypothetical protein [Niallia circulans]